MENIKNLFENIKNGNQEKCEIKIIIDVLNKLTPNDLKLLEKIYQSDKKVFTKKDFDYSEFNFENLMLNGLIRYFGDGIIQNNVFKLYEKYILTSLAKKIFEIKEK